jgi:transcription elongation factor
MVSLYDGDGIATGVVTVPAVDILPLIAAHSAQNVRANVRVGDRVEILSGEAKGYTGVLKQGGVVHVDFPSGRRFLVTAEAGSLRRIGGKATRNDFWGMLGSD